MLANCLRAFGICTHQFDDIAFFSRSAGGELELNQCKQTDLPQLNRRDARLSTDLARVSFPDRMNKKNGIPRRDSSI
jgi:hypothetical protein